MSWSTLNTRPYSDSVDKDYRVGQTSGNLLKLRDMGIPFPDQVIYRPYSIGYIRGDLSKVGDGVASIEWTWDVISIQELSMILNLWFTGVTDTSVDNVFIRSDVRTGDYPNPTAGFLDYDCTVWRPNLSGPEGSPIVKSSYGIQTVSLKFTNLVVVP